MALSDLLSKIESFDYNKVGTFQQGNLEDRLNSNPIENLGSTDNPQTFEANGSIVTGQQSFGRPLEEPLPIQEGVVGYGLRSLLSAPRGFDFFSNDRATGFTPNIISEGGNGPGSTQFNDLSDSISNFNPSLTYKDLTFEFSNDVLNPNEGSGDFKPIVTTPEGTTFEWPAADSPYEVDFFYGAGEPNPFITTIPALGFTKNVLSSDSDGPGLSQFAGVPLGVNPLTTNSTYDFVSSTYSDEYTFQVTSTIPNPFGGESTTITSTFLNLEDSIVFQGNTNISMQNQSFHGLGGLQFRRQAGRIVNWTDEPSNFVQQTENEDGNIDYSLHTDYMDTHQVVARADSIGNQVVISPGRGIGYPLDYTSAFIPGGKDGDVQVFPGDGLSEFGKLLRDEKRVMQIPVNRDGRAIDGKSALSDPLKMGDGFVDYIQKMSGGDSQPFIVRRPGNDYGFDTIDTSFSQGNLLQGFGKVLNFLDEIAGGFVRGTPTFSGRISREVDDAIRKGKFLFTTEGITFGIKQFFLQANNRTIETRIWNPASVFSTPDFVKIPRHLGSIEYEGLMKDPEGTIKSAVPSFIPEIITNKILSLMGGDTPGGIPTSRVAEQVGWVDINRIPSSRMDRRPTPPLDPEGRTDTEAGAARDQGEGQQGFSDPAPQTKESYIDKIKSTISKIPGNLKEGATGFAAGLIPDVGDITLAFHNPNHYFRLRSFGLFDIYGGPDAMASGIEEVKRLKENLETGANIPNQTLNFLEKGSKLEELHNKTKYKYLTYGQLNDSNAYEDYNLSPVDGKYQEATRNVGVTPNVGRPREENVDGSLTPHGANRMLESRVENDSDGRPQPAPLSDVINSNNFHDRVNAFPITETNNIPVDFVDFRFQTRQYSSTGTAEPRTIVFRASLNNINENVQPNYSEIKYLGRPEKFYLYDGVDRDINIDFTIYPKTAQEFPFLAEKLNYLVGLAYPQYNKSGIMVAPYVDLTLGDMFRRQPGYISNLAINVQDNTTWETEWFQFPKHITATLTFRYIGRYEPHQFGKHYDLPWLSQVTDGSGNIMGSTLHDTPKQRKDSTKPEKSIVNRVNPNKNVMSSDNIAKITAGWDENVLDNIQLYDTQVNPNRDPQADTEQQASTDPGYPQPAGADPDIPPTDLDPNPAYATSDEQADPAAAPGG